MTLFFNLANLEKESKDDCSKFVYLLKRQFKSSPVKGLARKTKLSLVGLSFILNPAPIFNLKNIDIIYIVQYIKLAALRDYSLYKYYGVKALQLSYFPDINLENIKSNPLLKITKTEITFIYE